MSSPYRTGATRTIEVDADLLRRAVEVLDQVGSLAVGWWDEHKAVRTALARLADGRPATEKETPSGLTPATLFEAFK